MPYVNWTPKPTEPTEPTEFARGKLQAEIEAKQALLDELKRTMQVNVIDRLKPNDAAQRGAAQVKQPEADPEADPWIHRSVRMRCRTCMFYVLKEPSRELGRCRRHAPTVDGFPMVYTNDWCGDHELHERG